MGRKKQTITCSGGIIGDHMGKNLAFMAGQVNNLISRDNSFTFESQEIQHYDKSKNMISGFSNDFFNFQTKMTGKIYNDHEFKTFSEEEKSKLTKNKKASETSFDYNRSFSDLKLEGFDSDVEFEESMREEGLKESFEMLDENFELDYEDEIEETDHSLNLEVEIEKEKPLPTFPKSQSFEENLKVLKELENEPLKVETKQDDYLTPLSSLTPITSKHEVEDLYSDDQDSLKDLIKTFSQIEIVEDNDDEGQMDLKGVDLKYEFDEFQKESLVDLLQKRSIPTNYNWTVFMLKAKKKIKDQLIFVEPNILCRDDNFYNLLIDRYRFKLYPT